MGFIERMRWWQWTALSVLLGALLGYVNSGGADVSPQHSSLPGLVFEELLLAPAYFDRAHSGALTPLLSGITVHPVQTAGSGGGGPRFQIVTFNIFTPPGPGHPDGVTETGSMLAPFPYEPMPRRRPRDENAEYPAATNYIGAEGDTVESVAKQFYGKVTPAGVRAIVGANSTLRNAKGPANVKIVPDQPYWIPWNPADGHTVSDFLVAATKLIARQRGAPAPAIRFRYAWWELPKYVYQVWIIGTVLVVGVIWPALIQLLVKGGFGRPVTEEEFDLKRFKPSAPERAAAVKTAVVTQSDMDRLRELEENMEATLKGGGSGAPAVAAATAADPAVVKPLAGGPAEAPVAPAAANEPEHYDGGVFYPVAIPHKKPEDKK
jgi:phage tail protein X